jgi:hypothetical protein
MKLNILRSTINHLNWLLTCKNIRIHISLSINCFDNAVLSKLYPRGENARHTKHALFTVSEINCRVYDTASAAGVYVTDDNTVEISFDTPPRSIKDFFDPIKKVLQHIDRVPQLDYPKLVRRTIKYLSPTDVLNDDAYYHTPYPKGCKAFVHITVNGVYLVTSYETLKLTDTVFSKLHETIIDGFVYYNQFTTVDITMYLGKQVGKYSLTNRLKLLKSVCAVFPYCEMAVYTKGTTNTTALIVPDHANYLNSSTFIHAPNNRIPLTFIVKPSKDQSVMRAYEIHTTTEHGSILFTGTRKNPFDGIISIPCDFNLSTNVIKFVWENNTFIPIGTGKRVSNISVAQNVWDILN